MNQSQYAKRIGISRSMVNRLVKKGVIHVDEWGDIDPAKADQALKDHQHPGYDHNRRATLPFDDHAVKESAPPLDLVGGDLLSGETDAQNSDGDTFRNHAKKEKKFKALIAEIDYLEKAGRLVDAKHMEVIAFQTFRDVRDALLNIPNRVAGALAAELGLDAATGQDKVFQILTKEITEALEEASHVDARSRAT
ncbi:MAG: hypothetical protein KDE20_18000 [Caldilineaceae bacterium]|nr:hypothetical protein [Caldilineaceae bacterium]